MFVAGRHHAVKIGSAAATGSRSMHVGGNALKRAADAIIEKAKPMAAMMMEAAAGDIEFKDGRFRIVGTDRSMALTDVAKAFYRPGNAAAAIRRRPRSVGHVAAEPPNYPNWLPRL